MAFTEVSGHLANTPTHGLVSSQTGQIVDWTACRLVKMHSGQLTDSQLADAATNIST